VLQRRLIDQLAGPRPLLTDVPGGAMVVRRVEERALEGDKGTIRSTFTGAHELTQRGLRRAAESLSCRKRQWTGQATDYKINVDIIGNN
jgi:hypothetical protein